MGDVRRERLGLLRHRPPRAALRDARRALRQARTFLFVGVLGGYTTFSSFGNETLNLLRGGEALAAAANAGGQLALGLLAVALGRAAAQLLWR